MKKTFSLLVATFLLGFTIPLSAASHKVSCSTMCYAQKGDDSLCMDRYTCVHKAKKEAMRPCLIFLFGGGFRGGDRQAEQYRPFFEQMACEGVDVLSIDYRLGLKEASAEDFTSPERFAGSLVRAIRLAVDDLYSATRYAIEQSHEWGINPDKILLCGSSAGAITVLQAEYMRCNGDNQAQMLPEGFRYAGVISLAGAIFHLGEELKWGSAPCPLLLFHGNADKNVPYGALTLTGAGFFGSHYIAQQLATAGTPHWFYTITGADHVVAESPMQSHRDIILQFIKQWVVGSSPRILHTEEIQPGVARETPTFRLEEYIQTNYM